MASAQREAVRAQVTKTRNEVETELNKQPIDAGKVKLNFERLERHMFKLRELDEQIEKEMRALNANEQAFADDYLKVSEYMDEFFELKENLLRKIPQASTSSGSGNGQTSAPVNKKYNLPILEFKKFDGDPKDWLSFWGQYKSIDDDKTMSNEMKFQYLLQSTAEKSRAREVVESYPPTRDNYPKVIEYLKSRFGSDDVLVEVYVRDLLMLVLNNLSGKEKMNISRIYDKLETQLRVLESLGVTSDKYAAMLYPLVESSLPSDTLRVWERSKAQHLNVGENKLTGLMKFLRAEVDSEVRIDLAKTGFKTKQRNSRGNEDETIPTAAGLFSGGTSKGNCIFCDKGNHNSQLCYSLKKMTLEEKSATVTDKKACFVCLKPGHFTGSCKSKSKCPLCEKKHNLILCPENPKNKLEQPTGEKDSGSSTVGAAMSNLCVGGTILQTVVVRVINGSVNRTARLLFDTGAQQSYVTKKAVSIMGYQPIEQLEMKHCLFGGSVTKETQHAKYEVELESLDGSYNCKLKLLDEDTLCGKISRVPNGPWMKTFEKAGVILSDIGKDLPDINIMLGADVIGPLLTGNIVRSKEGPIAIQTKLSWTVMGVSEGQLTRTDSTLLVTQMHVSDASIQNLWKLDVLGITDPYETKNNDELMESALTLFKNTVKRDETGRYEVSLPWLDNHPPVSRNREAAVKRLHATTKKLKQNGYYDKYDQVIKNWELMQVIERIEEKPDEINVSYLPHHAVVKKSSQTTPVRPVMDASAREKGRPSLNDCLESGPNLIEMILDILLNFRLRRHGVVSDVIKAFLQIGVQEADRNFLRFLWWETEGKLIVYRHRRVVFGVTSSPFLLAATLNYLLDKEDRLGNKWIQIIRKSFYVDNLITSLDSQEDIQSFIQTTTKLLEEGKFELHEWMWNGKIRSTEVENNYVPLLGLQWNVITDELMLDIREVDVRNIPITKRVLLSYAGKVFDPLGMCCPVTLQPKLLLQKLWKKKITWDEAVDDDTSSKFLSWLSELPYLKEIKIPRWLKEEFSEDANATLHIFNDASQLSYGTCAFIRIEENDSVNVQFLMGKARVAPTKPMTIPRFELMACGMGARLAQRLQKTIKVNEDKCYYWTDSSDALYWITKHENWGQFVWNRVDEIKKLTDANRWRHIAGEHNPADLPSRGCCATKFIELNWIRGPKWLTEPEEQWPVSTVQCDMNIIMAEKRKTVVANIATEMHTPWYAQKFSSYRKILRLIAWMRRLALKIKHEPCNTGDINIAEELHAEQKLWHMIQSEGLSEKENILKQMNIITDENGVIRVRSKIVMRDDSRDFRYPVLLPSHHPVVKRYVEHVHQMSSHIYYVNG